MSYMNINRTGARRWTTTLAAAASLTLATSGYAQTAPPPDQPPAAQQPAPAAASGNRDLAKQHLTAARNALNDVTQLPAATQLAGEPRVQVQQLISNFNELISKQSDWRAAYAKVEANLDALLGGDAAAPTPTPAGTPGAVGTSGTTPAVDPAIRAKLTEFRAHLDRFEAVVDATPEPAAATPAEPPATAATEDRPDSPPPAPEDEQSAAVTKELLNHVEAVEVILGAQATAQRSATAAAGGAVTSADTPSGSTKTTIAGPNVTLNAEQLNQINTHLKELRRLLEKK